MEKLNIKLTNTVSQALCRLKSLISWKTIKFSTTPMATLKHSVIARASGDAAVLRSLPGVTVLFVPDTGRPPHEP